MNVGFGTPIPPFASLPTLCPEVPTLLGASYFPSLKICGSSGGSEKAKTF